LLAADGDAIDNFGFSVATNGDSALIGARFDDDNGSNSGSAYVFSLTPPNQPPEADAGGPYTSNEGGDVVMDGTGSSDPDSDPLTYAWRVDSALCSFSNPAAAMPLLACSDNGSFTVTLTVDDGTNDPSVDSASITVSNIAPTATYANDGPIDEGSSFTLSLTNPFDPSSNDTAAGFEYAFDCGDGNGYGTFSGTSSAVCPTDDNAIRSVGGKIRDKDGGETEYTDSVTVNNVPPTIENVTAPTDPVNINEQPVSVGVAFSDPGTADTHDVTWDWGDSTSDTQQGATSPALQNHSYAEAGVYTVTVTVTDDDGGSNSAVYEYIVIYDPDGGFVTGGGWIDSPAGAYKPDESLTGKASFGFVSKYKKGANVPTGNTEFNFKAGAMDFHSDSYEWLVVTGGNYAKFKGTGTSNGEGSYKFQLWAGDGASDTFRIKIWDEEDDVENVVYDNGSDQDIDGGSIVVHEGK
jgi:hypothetical protein